MEGAIVKLVTMAGGSTYRDILTGIESGNYYDEEKFLFEQLFESVDDKTNWVFFKSGEANRYSPMNLDNPNLCRIYKTNSQIQC